MQNRIGLNFLTKAVLIGMTVCIAVAIPYLYSLLLAQEPQPMTAAKGTISEPQPTAHPTTTVWLVYGSDPNDPLPTEHPLLGMRVFVMIDGTPVPIDPRSTPMPDKVYIYDSPKLGVSVGMMPPENSTLDDLLPKDENGNRIHTPMDEAMAQAMTAYAESRKMGTNSITLGGPQTAGSTITIEGQSVQLPPDFYIEQTFVSILCDVPSADYCPKAPVHVIRNSSTGNGLALDANGRAYNAEVSAEALAQAKVEFAPILKQLEGAE